MVRSITGPLFKWFGSKWLSSKNFSVPRHDAIVEPFAGSASYSLRHSEHAVIICETDVMLNELWSWLIEDATDQDIMEIPLDTPVGTDIRKLGLSRGQALLLKSWQRTNNVGNCWTISPWGNKPGQWTANTRARVSDQIGAIKHWRFWHAVNGIDAIETLELDATWFIDPPYKYNYGYGQPPIDYERLAAAIHRRRDHVIACEAVCKKTSLRPCYLPFVDFGQRITSRRASDKHHHSFELVWENR